MIRAINLGNNVESVIEPKDLSAQNLSNVWLELVDPTENELQAASDVTQLPINFLKLPKTEGYVNLRLEQGLRNHQFSSYAGCDVNQKIVSSCYGFFKGFSSNSIKERNRANHSYG